MPFKGPSFHGFHVLFAACSGAFALDDTCNLTSPKSGSPVLLQHRENRVAIRGNIVIECGQIIEDHLSSGSISIFKVGVSEPFLVNRFAGRFNFTPITSPRLALPCALCGEKRGAGSGASRGASKRPKLYGVLRRDGLGEQLGGAVFHMATAQRLGLVFGGMLSFGDPMAYGETTEAALFEDLSKVSGIPYEDLVTEVRRPSRPVFDWCFPADKPLFCDESAETLARSSESLKDTDDSIFLACLPGVERIHWGPELLTPEFLSAFRSISHIWSIPTRHFTGRGTVTGGPHGGPHVAMHLRRGDLLIQNLSEVQRHTMKIRYVKNERYLELGHQIKKLLPEAKIHIFSTTGTMWQNSSFDVFRKKGFHVHLDGEELEDLAHLANADLLVSAPSSFSFVAQLLNPNCVVALSSSQGKFTQGPGLAQWIQHRGDFDEDFVAKLRSCINKNATT